jgi:hypothetical protein
MIKFGIPKQIPAAVIFILSAITLSAQTTDCKVSMPSIAGSYSGECKKGLAHGKGNAQGIDHYSGTFRDGLPHGTGIYTWADGSRYEGNWVKGLKDGSGRMITRDSTYTGIWKNDVYAGRERLVPYVVTHSQNITKWSFYKAKGTNNAVRIRFYQGAVEGGGLISVDIGYNSGVLYTDGAIRGIQNPSFPIEIRIKFTAMNSFAMSQFTGDLVFTINEPGDWDVRVTY